MTVVTLAQASTIVDAALEKGRKTNCAPLTVAVLDSGGHLVALKREDKSGLLRVDIAFGKAWGALGMGFGSRTLTARAAKAPQFYTMLAAASGGYLVTNPGRRADQDCRRRHHRGSRHLRRHVRQGRSLCHRRDRGGRPEGRSRAGWVNGQTRVRTAREIGGFGALENAPDIDTDLTIELHSIVRQPLAVDLVQRRVAVIASRL